MAKKSSSAKYYAANPKAKKKKNAYQKIFNATSAQKANRRELEKKRYAAKKKGADTSNSDYDHAVGRRVAKSVNRGRAEGGRIKGKAHNYPKTIKRKK